MSWFTGGSGGVVGDGHHAPEERPAGRADGAAPAVPGVEQSARVARLGHQPVQLLDVVVGAAGHDHAGAGRRAPRPLQRRRPFPDCYRVLLGFTEFCGRLQYWNELWMKVNEFYLVVPSFTGFYWVLLGFTGFYWVFVGFIRFYWVFPSFTGFYRVLLGFTRF